MLLPFCHSRVELQCESKELEYIAADLSSWTDMIGVETPLIMTPSLALARRLLDFPRLSPDDMPLSS